MTTTTVFASITGNDNDGRVQSSSTIYANARTASSLGANVAETLNALGQRFVTPTYFCLELFFAFDTSGIPDTDTIDSVVLSLYGGPNNSQTDDVYEARLNNDWAVGGLTTADWVAGDNLGNYTLLATFASSGGWTNGGYNAFTSEAAFAANINKTGMTYIFCSSQRMRLNQTPTQREDVDVRMADNSGTTQDPKLVVEHTAGGGGAARHQMGLMGFVGG